MSDGYNGNIKNQEIQRLQDIIAEKDEVITALRMGWDEAEAKLKNWTRRSESCESKLGQLEANEEVMILSEVIKKMEGK